MASAGSRTYNRWPAGDAQSRGGQFAPKMATPAPIRQRDRKRSEPVRPSTRPLTPAETQKIVRGLSKVGDEDLALAYVQLAAHPDRAGRAEALAAMDAELARREGVARLRVEDDHRSRQIDDLVSRGRSYVEAHAEAHGLDPTKLDRQQRAALVDANRRAGERRDQTIRRMYAEHVYLSYLDAEEQTRGNVLSAAGRAKGIDPVSLWSGQAARARKYASDELKQWWEEHGDRHTFTQFRAQYAGTAGDRRRAKDAQQAGAGRDYGL